MIKNSFINLYRQSEDAFFRSLSTQCLDIGHEITAYMTGVPIKTLNPAYIRENLIEIEVAFQQIQQFYDKNDISFEVIIPEGLGRDHIDLVLRRLDYSQVATTVAMGMILKDTQISHDQEIRIEATNTHLNDWAIPILEAFESTTEILEKYKTAHHQAMAKGSGFYHYTLYDQSKPVSSLTLSIHHKGARIDDVGTLPDFQGKGYATCLVKYALMEAQNKGATHCFLEASKAGFPLYQKNGFEPLFQNRVYTIRRKN